MDEDQWMYEGIMLEEVDMDYENEEECGDLSGSLAEPGQVLG